MNRSLFRGALACLTLVVLSPAADAGIVFLKNGYILQAPVEDRTAELVVLKYPSGKVTVEERFIKHVVLDPAEEAMIQQRRNDKKEPSQVRAPRLEQEVVLSELPTDLGKLAIKSERVDNSANDPAATSQPAETDSNDDPTPVTTVEPVPNPAFEFEPVELEFFALRGERPDAWAVSTEGNRVTMHAPDSNSPSVAVDRFSAAFRVSDASSAVTTLMANEFQQVDVLLQEETRFAGLPAVRLLGEDTIRGVQFKAWLVVSNDETYWISAQWKLSATDAERKIVERIVTSMTFAQ